MFDPVKASNNIKEEFIDYVETTFSLADENLRRQFHDALEGIIDAGPYLEINDVFKTGKSMNQLIDEGVLSPLFRNLEAGKPVTMNRMLPLDRPLYLHQEKAITRIAGGDNLVISTGTGSGKTNCFLIPVIDELLKEQEAGTLGDGIRAIFIYPMNALANDQIKNLRKILMEYPSITFGVYNGATEEDEEEAENSYLAMYAQDETPKLRKPLPNEMISREKMKEHPPHILFTNYAMLEHLLLRPNDDVLFTHSHFRFIILDEAHVYSGATGIETSMLLRRLRARIDDEKTQFILTSATLGGKESDEDVALFASNLTNAEFTEDNIVRADRDEFEQHGQSIIYPEKLYLELDDEKNDVKDVFRKYRYPFDEKRKEEELIYDFVESSSLYAELRSIEGKAIPLSTIIDELEVDEEVAIAFISLCSKAEKGGKALIDARYHYFIRSLEGAFFCYADGGKLFLNRQSSYKDNAVFEIAICNECGHFAFLGKEVGGYLAQTSSFNAEPEYYYPFDGAGKKVEDEDEGVEEHYLLCRKCGALIQKTKKAKTRCEHDLDDYVEVVKSSKNRCGHCHVGDYHRFYLGNEAATGVLATALYEELPQKEFVPIPESELPNRPNPLLQSTQANHRRESAKARQFLAFSDSRQEAAKFACYMEKSYQEFLRRRGVTHYIMEHPGQFLGENVMTISDFADRLTPFFDSRRTFPRDNEDRGNLTPLSRHQAWVALINELGRYSSSTSLTRLGILQFHYLGNTEEIVDTVENNYGKGRATKDEIRNLLDLLAFEIIKNGAVIPDDDTILSDDDREYIFYMPRQKYVVKEASPNQKSANLFAWMPKHRSNGNIIRNNRLNYVKEILHMDDDEAADFLKIYFEYLIGNPLHPLKNPNSGPGYVFQARDIQVRIAGDPEAKWYRCNSCGRVSQFHVHGHCLIADCGGEVEEVKDPSSLYKGNHFAKLYFSDNFSPLFIKEHTAQLSKKDSLKYQEEFIRKEINALSCSTTFEMGVDVGDLETVFLRDVPPLPSNYAQRAGRAGRSLSVAAYALTFAKLSSHDLTFFKEPEKMIKGTILPPLFKLDNEKIVRRHVYAVALSKYFAKHPEQYNHDDAEKFINEKGYEDFADWLWSKPKDLKDMILRSIPDIGGLHQEMGLKDFSWLNGFIGPEGIFTNLLNEYWGNVGKFDKLIQEYVAADDLAKAADCRNRKNAYMHNRLIEFLARGNILPRYGFPVDTVELEQNDSENRGLRLTRDLQMAIGEYAPSSEVVANGKLYTSRYIKKSNLGNRQDWKISYIAICPKNKPNSNDSCGTFNFSDTPVGSSGMTCISCGQNIPAIHFHPSIEPRSGFVSERSKAVPLTSQTKNYRSEAHYIGNKVVIKESKYSFNGIEVKVESTTNDSMLITSEKSFYVCPECGYALSEEESIAGDAKASKQMKNQLSQVTTSKSHRSLYGRGDCSCHTFNRYGLHHVFYTDVAKISFGCDTSSHDQMLSVMYAILYAMSDVLNIERRDINATLSTKTVNGSWCHSIIIYDTVPGGAGHSRRLATADGEMLRSIFEAAYDRVHSCTCHPSCYSCLRSYENQKKHDKLDREKAEEFLTALLGRK